MCVWFCQRLRLVGGECGGRRSRGFGGTTEGEGEGTLGCVCVCVCMIVLIIIN